jgi:hypothetical protein
MASSYGSTDTNDTPLPGCGTPDFSQNGFTATCFSFGGGEAFLFNFTGASFPTDLPFTIDFGNTPASEANIVGGCDAGHPVPCTSDSNPPFDVNGTFNSGVQSFVLSGLGPNDSGLITVSFDYINVDSALTPPIITSIGSPTTGVPEPGSFALLAVGMGLVLFGVSLRRRNRFN